MAELPENLRAAILMHYLEGATQDKIANTLGVHQSTVSRRLSDGIEFLRERLRSAGHRIPAALIVACLAPQTSMAAPSSFATSLAKISLAGFGEEVAGTSQIAWPASIAKGLSAILFLPLVAGVVWGELIFLVVLGVLSSYIFPRRPEWFRVICFTRQFPNIYEWPLFPFKRWTWQTPPREWQLWMAASIVIGIELVGAAVVSPALAASTQGSLLLMAAGFWGLFTGIRIWRRVRYCNGDLLHVENESDFPIDGALLLTYGLACAVLFAKLLCFTKVPFRLFIRRHSLLAAILCSIVWSSILVFGALLTLKRLRLWRIQGPVDPT